MKPLRFVQIINRVDAPASYAGVWENLKLQDAGESFDVSSFDKVSIQITGDSEYKIQIQGSNDGENWHALIDTQDNHMIFSAPGLAEVGQLSRYIQPLVIAGDDMTDISVWIVCRGARR